MTKITITASNKRQDSIRRARSVNDLIDVLQDISVEVHKNRKSASTLMKSLSASTKGDEGEIRINRTGVGPTPTKIPLKTEPQNETLGVKLTSFKAPPITRIRSAVSLVQSMYDNAQELDSIEALLTHAFSGAKNQERALSAVRSLKKEVDGSIHDALSALNAIAEHHVPTEMQKLNKRLIGFVLDNINPKAYSEITELMYVAPVNNTLEFSLYLCLHSLKDGKGFNYNEFYVVLTGVVEGATIRYFLTTLPDFKVPGKYEIGKPVASEADMVKRIRLLMAANDILVEEERRVVPVARYDLRNAGAHRIEGVADIDVKSDAIYVFSKKGYESLEARENIFKEVSPLLQRVLGFNTRTRSRLAHKSVTHNGRKAIKIIIMPDPRGKEKSHHVLNVERLHELKQALDLTDHEVDVIKKGLKSLL